MSLPVAEGMRIYVMEDYFYLEGDNSYPANSVVQRPKSLFTVHLVYLFFASFIDSVYCYTVHDENAAESGLVVDKSETTWLPCPSSLGVSLMFDKTRLAYRMETIGRGTQSVCRVVLNKELAIRCILDVVHGRVSELRSLTDRIQMRAASCMGAEMLSDEAWKTFVLSDAECVMFHRYVVQKTSPEMWPVEPFMDLRKKSSLLFSVPDLPMIDLVDPGTTRVSELRKLRGLETLKVFLVQMTRIECEDGDDSDSDEDWEAGDPFCGRIVVGVCNNSHLDWATKESGIGDRDEWTSVFSTVVHAAGHPSWMYGHCNVACIEEQASPTTAELEVDVILVPPRGISRMFNSNTQDARSGVRPAYNEDWRVLERISQERLCSLLCVLKGTRDESRYLNEVYARVKDSHPVYFLGGLPTTLASVVSAEGESLDGSWEVTERDILEREREPLHAS